MLLNVVTQKYTGDITIVPSFSYFNILKLFSDPSIQDLFTYCEKGERSTWPLMCIIRNNCVIELLIEHLIHKLKSELIEAKQLAGLNSSSSSLPLPRVNKKTY